ncbi:alpha/beta fold hydrolase [Buttiauxella massiliensis]|uniref:alpha/beta fold hydrolase n=1 Tax=Buttiauxella massiliensis TaxID=2831590 RepID=UPI00125F8BB2|nr:alpha/beta hydrolase [Buttiauxella massiliensis]
MNTSPLLENHDTPLIFLGGTLCNGRLWQPLIEQLNVAHYSCVTLSGGDSAYTLAKQLLEVLPPRFCLAGFSLGAMVALQMVALAPLRIAGLALLSVNPLRDLPGNASSRRAAIKEAASEGITPWLTKNMWAKYVAPHRLDDAALHQKVVQMAEECGLDVFASQTEVAISRDDHRAALAAFTAPILIINGAYDVICTPQHHQAAAAIAMRNWIQESAS